VLALSLVLISARSIAGQPLTQISGAASNEARGNIWVGYQAWFSAGPHDPFGIGVWFHYSLDSARPPLAGNLNVDLWPDTSSYAQETLVPTGLLKQDGKPLYAYSAGHPAVIEQHLELMQKAQIQGPFLQRFLSDIKDPNLKKWRNEILQRLRVSAARTGRVFALMYDLSGVSNGQVQQILPADITELAQAGVFKDAHYMTEHGRPLIALWGLGFNDRNLDPLLMQNLIDQLHRSGYAVMGGVPFFFRVGGHDVNADPRWLRVFDTLDVVSPWAVGRYGSADEFSKLLPQLAEDMRSVESKGHLFLPVLFPGFSWHNLSHGSGPSNFISRQGGRFLWAQAKGYADLGIRSFYVAMFDEVDEGTAVFPLEPVTNVLPSASRLLGLDVDGYSLAPDFYLRLIQSFALRMSAGQSLPAQLPVIQSGFR
jgi:hypothetical protein